MVLKCEILLDILSMNFVLSREQKRELLEELHLEEGRRCAERIKSILLLEEGKPISRIAEYLFLDEGTVRNYVKRYKSGGLRKLISNNHKGRSSYLSEEQKKVLSMILESRVYSSTKEVIELVKSKFNIIPVLCDFSGFPITKDKVCGTVIRRRYTAISLFCAVKIEKNAVFDG